MNIDHKHNKETDRLWRKSEESPFIKNLKAGQTMPEVMAQLDSQRVFEEIPKALGCSDGRCQEHRLGLAGNGILLSERELNEFVNNNKGQISMVMSHEGCGAAALEYERRKKAGEPLPEEVVTSDDFGIFHSKNLAKRLGAEYGHTKACDMSGKVHNERAIYLDGRRGVNPKALPELPAGFICSGPVMGLDSSYMRKEIETLASIALGDHGFGGRFNKDNPLYVVVSAESEEQLKELKKEASIVAKKFDGRLAVDGFLAK